MKKLIAVIAAAIITALTGVALAATGTGTATWTWSAPLAYTDGTPIASGTAITYNQYLGTAGPGSEASTASQTGITALTVQTSGYSAGMTVCAQITAVIGGKESVKSNEACKTFPAIPNPPSNLTVQ